MRMRPGILLAASSLGLCILGGSVGRLVWQRHEVLTEFTRIVEQNNACELPDALASIRQAGLSEEAIPLLTDMLEADALSRSRIRGSPLKALAQFAPESIPAVETLVREHPRPEVRSVGTWVFSEMGETATSAVPTLIAALDDKNESVRLGAAQSLAKVDPDTVGHALPILLAFLHHKEPIIRVNALHGIGAFGRRAEAATPLVINALQSEEPITRSAAASALGEIAEADEDVISALIDALHDKCTYSGRWQAIHALGQFGPAAKAAIPVLRELLADEDLKDDALDALNLISPDTCHDRS